MRMPERPIISPACLLLLGLLLVPAASAEQAPERIPWRKVPVPVVLGVGEERLVHFPGAVEVGLPTELQDDLRVQSIAGTLYLLAKAPFPTQRILVRSPGGGTVYLLDLSAQASAGPATALVIYEPDAPAAPGEVEAADTAHYGYVALTRFAAQQLYAPARLLKDLPGLVREPVATAPVALLRGAAVQAQPLMAWRAGALHLTAVLLVNTSAQPQVLDPRRLRGQWLAASFQHNRLQAAGSEADRTAVYLLSEQPLAAALR